MRFGSPDNSSSSGNKANLHVALMYIYIYAETTVLCGRFIQNTMSERGRCYQRCTPSSPFNTHNEPASYFNINIIIPRLLDGLG